jgi:hypothetical protein
MYLDVENRPGSSDLPFNRKLSTTGELVGIEALTAPRRN